MELADIKGFIKRYSESYLFLSGIKSLSWMYIFIGLIPLGYGIITRKFIVASITVIMVISYTAITNILVRKMTSISYYQRFLLSGSSSLFTSLFFLMLPYSLVETVMSDRMTQIVYSLLIGLAWILAVFLIFSFEVYNTKKGKYSKAKSKKKNRAGIAAFSSIGAILGISLMKIASKWMTQEVAINVVILSALSLSDSSSVAATISKNMEFMYEIRNALLDFASEAAILIAVYFSIQTNKATNCNAYHTDKAHFISRIAVILLFSFVISGLKFLVLPQNFLTTIHVNNSVSHSTEPSFDYNRSFTTISRAIGYHERKEIYRKTHGMIYYGDKKVLDIKMDYEFEGNPIEVRTVKGMEIRIICKNQAIAYFKNEKPYVVSFQDINWQSNDIILLEVCKELLSEGRLDCFEYICSYIMRYNPDFVQQYLRRYIVSDFTSEELSQVGEISIDYITKTAQRFYNGLSA